MAPDTPTSCPHCSSHEEKPAAHGVVEAPAAYICPMCEGVRFRQARLLSAMRHGIGERTRSRKRNEPECCGDGGDDEVKDLWWRVRWSAAMTDAGRAARPWAWICRSSAAFRTTPPAWMQFVWATPVVFWVGWPLLARFLKSLRTLRFNMFTLIGLGVLAAWLYSTLALFAPGMAAASSRRTVA
jgi:Cu+-exporting ATPase